MIQFKNGWTGIIVGFHDVSLAKHLMPLGLTIGKGLSIVSKSPFGRTYRVVVDNRSIALREVELRAIKFEEKN